MGLPACGISCLTNRAAGISTEPLSHAEVIQVAKQVEGRFLALLRALVPLAFAAVPARAASS
jgi:purine-nucleoside phosphorylase